MDKLAQTTFKMRSSFILSLPIHHKDKLHAGDGNNKTRITTASEKTSVNVKLLSLHPRLTTFTSTLKKEKILQQRMYFSHNYHQPRFAHVMQAAARMMRGNEGNSSINQGNAGQKLGL